MVWRREQEFWSRVQPEGQPPYLGEGNGVKTLPWYLVSIANKITCKMRLFEITRIVHLFREANSHLCYVSFFMKHFLPIYVTSLFWLCERL